MFQGRYKAILVERDSHLLELCRYVVLNPVRAGRVKRLERYPWSSHPATLGLAARPDWLSTGWLLRQFSTRRSTARQRYAAFVAQGIGVASPWGAVKGQVLLGSDAFAKKLRPLLEDQSKIGEITRAQRHLNRPSLMELLSGKTLGAKTKRDPVIRQAYLEFGYSMAAIARQVGIHYSTVSKIISGER